MDLGKKRIRRVRYPKVVPERREQPQPVRREEGKPDEQAIPVPNWPTRKPAEVPQEA